MKTIKIYEKMETSKLQTKLLEFEDLLEQNELIIDSKKLKNENFDEFKKQSEDYEIDISLIRMQLTKRLWNSSDIEN